MPIQYASILDEARSVRSRAGIFDVSHMGRVDIRGPGAPGFLDRIFSTAVSQMKVARARYGVICNEQGGIIDDCIVYRCGEESFLLVPNAANTPAALEWLSRWAPKTPDVRIEEITSQYSMVALQGPKALSILDDLTPAPLESLRFFATVDTQVAGTDAFVAHTGYTGEDGFELIFPQEKAAEIWGVLSEKGAEPCGLGARDVLRLEAGLLLHGNDMDASINPYEAGLDRFVDPDREGYVAGEVLRRVREAGPERRLVGFNMIGRGVARHGHPLTDGSKELGHVTSGGYSPTLDRNIGLGYVPPGYTASGSKFQVDIRGRPVDAEVTTLPFYSRRKSA